MAPSGTAQAHGACSRCLRRAWLLGELSAVLDRLSGDRSRLLDALALEDEQLLAALAGRRRDELAARMAALDEESLRPPAGIVAVCRHDRGYPRALADPAAPGLLFHSCAAGRLAELTAGPVVSILGARRCSAYGSEIARALGRGLAAAGVTVASALTGALATAAHAGAREARGTSVAVAGAGLRSSTSARGPVEGGADPRAAWMCTVTELPCGCSGRRWGAIAAERLLAGLCTVLVVVEASDAPRELGAAELARARGRVVAAVPGRVTSPLSAGPHALLRRGATLIGGAEDVLELLHGSSSACLTSQSRAHGEGLEPRLRGVLERVACGCETVEELCRGAGDPGEVLLALSELELMGLLLRADGGRYLPRAPSPEPARSPVVEQAGAALKKHGPSADASI
jgi:DNA processing protein